MVYARLVWIALQNNGLDSANVGASRARIAHWRELVFDRASGSSLAPPSALACNGTSSRQLIKEFTNQGDRVSRFFFHQPMS